MLEIIGKVTGKQCVHDDPKNETGDDSNWMALNNEDEGRTSNDLNWPSILIERNHEEKM